MTSNLAYSLSENFIAAFLPHLVSTEKMGKLSGLAWGMGYFGGLGSILICQKVTGLQYDISNWERLKWVGPITGIFFLVASIPSLLWLKEPPRSSSEGTGLDQIMHTWLALKRLPDLKWFLISCFLYQGGIAIVISFAALYGELEIGLSGAWQAIFFISLQLTAASGAFFFGWIQNRLGAIRTLDITLVIWVISVLLIFSLPMWARLLEIQNLKLAFVIVGNVTGACLGATQSCGRAVVGLFSPKERSGEFFGLWGFSVKCASVFSLFFFGILQAIFSLRLSLLLCAGFFLGSLVIHRFIDEKRGIELGV
jgi:UMF1 family MFS transporter